MSQAIWIVRRISLIALAYLIASLAAAMLLSVGFWITGPRDSNGKEFELTGLILVSWGMTFISALFVALPVIICAESARMRSLLFYAAFGSLFGILLLVLGAPRFEGFLLFSAGAVGGSTYWALAGRTAGNWGQTSRPNAVEG
jgi:hypothetical protein